jgi:hypothetical protein
MLGVARHCQRADIDDRDVAHAIGDPATIGAFDDQAIADRHGCQKAEMRVAMRGHDGVSRQTNGRRAVKVARAPCERSPACAGKHEQIDPLSRHEQTRDGLRIGPGPWLCRPAARSHLRPCAMQQPLAQLRFDVEVRAAAQRYGCDYQERDDRAGQREAMAIHPSEPYRSSKRAARRSRSSRRGPAIDFGSCARRGVARDTKRARAITSMRPR